MKILRYALGIVCSMAVLVALLITSIEIAAYSDFGYYADEYTKYNVLEAVDMELDDLMEVTEHMMAYLRGDRDELQIETIVGGEPRGFFNDREIAHMVDVRNLFLGGLDIRLISCAIAAACLVILVFTRTDLKRVLPASFQWGTGLFFVIAAVIAGVVASDFSKYFIVFHHIFFTNDLWLLDPATDLLINIVPEPFFMDMTVRIGVIFAAFIVALLLTSTVLRIYFRKKESSAHV